MVKQKNINLSMDGGADISKRANYAILGSVLGVTLCTGAVLASSRVNADDTVVDDVSIEVPVACSMGGVGQDSHTATLMNGIYSGGTQEYANGIGSTTLTTYCNDNNGFSIYAIGYTNDTIGNNTLLGTNTNLTIPTGIYNSNTTTNSTWSMKVTAGRDSGDTTNHPLTIDNSFNNYHTVPGEQDGYTRIAYKDASTDMTTSTGGTTLTTTYDTYISPTQAADTYEGQVKYVMVHPYNHRAPIASLAVLDTGRAVNSKLKSLAATVVNGTETTITPEFDPDGDYEYGSDNYVKSIDVHLKTPAPNGFTPTEANTISLLTSQKPIYIVFDNANDAGIMHFYTEAEQIALPSDSSFMFYFFFALADLSDISDWDTSSVTDMSEMFFGAGYSATTFALDLSSWNTDNVTNMSYMFAAAGDSATTWSIGDLSSWDTANVTDMSGMFSGAGSSATTFALGDLSSWDTSSVTDMHNMFFGAGSSATTFALNLSSWNTVNVANMSYMFEGAGSSATTFTLNLSSWNTANVTNMYSMFYEAGYSATTWSVTIPQTNGNNVSNTTSRIYGQDSLIYGEPDSGKLFTLAQPATGDNPGNGGM